MSIARKNVENLRGVVTSEDGFGDTTIPNPLITKAIPNIVRLTQTEYDALIAAPDTSVADCLYVITAP